MSALHLVFGQSVAACQARAGDDDAILMLGDGVVGAVAPRAGDPPLPDGRLHVLGPDLAARGLAKIRLAAGCTVIDYEGFVALACAHAVTQSWD